MLSRRAYNMTPAELDHERKEIVRMVGHGNHNYQSKAPAGLFWQHPMGHITNCDLIIEAVEIYWRGYAYTGIPLYVCFDAFDCHHRKMDTMVSIHVHPNIHRTGDFREVWMKRAHASFEVFEKKFGVKLLDRLWNKALYEKLHGHQPFINHVGKTAMVRTLA